MLWELRNKKTALQSTPVYFVIAMPIPQTKSINSEAGEVDES